MKDNIDIFKNFALLVEQEFDCKLCLHDYTGVLAHGNLPHMHFSGCCVEYKKSNSRSHKLCMSFDQKMVHEKMSMLGRGFFKVCHCGILEAVFPVYCRGALAGIIFAGPFAHGEAELSVPVSRTSDSTLRSLDDDERSRLMYMGEILASYLGNCCTPVFGSDREGMIRDYFQHRASDSCACIGELAEKLGLTAPRASEAVKKIFGKNFQQLLNEERVKIACLYLNNTGYSINEIAYRSGFSDGTYFHRVFRRVMKMTPGIYRQMKNRVKFS